MSDVIIVISIFQLLIFMRLESRSSILGSTEVPIEPSCLSRLGDLKATWGKAQSTDEPVPSEFADEFTCPRNEDLICPTHSPRVGELEATWGQAQEPPISDSSYMNKSKEQGDG